MSTTEVVCTVVFAIACLLLVAAFSSLPDRLARHLHRRALKRLQSELNPESADEEPVKPVRERKRAIGRKDCRRYRDHEGLSGCLRCSLGESCPFGDES